MTTMLQELNQRKKRSQLWYNVLIGFLVTCLFLFAVFALISRNETRSRLSVVEASLNNVCKQTDIDKDSCIEILKQTIAGKTEVGPRGAQGLAGSAGKNGTPGDKGDRGTAGSNGESGEPGKPGSNGAAGEQGSPGSAGSNGSNGLPGDKGDTGEPGGQGPQGEKGNKGDKGDRGDTGSDGSPATPFTFTFTIPGVAGSELGSSTFTCVISSPNTSVVCSPA